MIDEGIESTEHSKNLSDADKVALEYSSLMNSNPEKIDEAFYKKLAKYFSTEEIIELGAYIGFNVGYHRFFGTLQFYPMFSPDGKLVTQEESRKIYGDTPVSHLDVSKDSQKDLRKSSVVGHKKD